MTSSVTPDSSRPSSDPAASARPEDVSADSSVEKANKVQSKIILTSSDLSATLNPNDTEITLKEVKDKRKKRKIGGQKIKEITARKPGEKKPVDVSPTEWKTLTKVTDKAKERFWPEKHWKKALYSPVSIFA
nr:hypothetical protein [Candidatus Anoxychlamydiales bacterium]